MSEVNLVCDADSNSAITIESYGVRVRFESNVPKILELLFETSSKALIGNLKVLDGSGPVEHSFAVIGDESGNIAFFRDGELVTTSDLNDLPLELFTRLLRLKISEFSEGSVFLHAGVVGWKGKAIVIPGDSGKGKTTLVIELVKNGAEYYSDEYAVLDENGLVHPFTRDLSVRQEGTVWSEKDGIPVENFGGERGTIPLPVGLLILTDFQPESEWTPEFISVGSGILEAIRHTIPLRINPEFSLNVLKNALSRAIIVKSPRADAAETAKKILSLIDI